MWGSSLGNIDGFANENPLPKLVKTLESFKGGLKSGDLMILGFDTEADETRIFNAYSEPSLRAQILSVVRLLKRDGYILQPGCLFYSAPLPSNRRRYFDAGTDRRHLQ